MIDPAGAGQVVFDGKIPAKAGQAVLRKPIDEKEQNGNGASKGKREKAGV